MRQREERRDARAHGIAHDVATPDAEMIEQRPRVLGQNRQRVAFGIMRLVALPVAAVVERHHATPRVGQGLDPERVDPVDRVV